MLNIHRWGDGGGDSLRAFKWRGFYSTKRGYVDVCGDDYGHAGVFGRVRLCGGVWRYAGVRVYVVCVGVCWVVWVWGVQGWVRVCLL